MGHFFSAQANDIEKQLKESYFNRSQIFEEAFELIAKPSLSVPVLLAQCDGFVHEQFGKSCSCPRKRRVLLKKSTVRPRTSSGYLRIRYLGRNVIVARQTSEVGGL